MLGASRSAFGGVSAERLRFGRVLVVVCANRPPMARHAPVHHANEVLRRAFGVPKRGSGRMLGKPPAWRLSSFSLPLSVLLLRAPLCSVFFCLGVLWSPRFLHISACSISRHAQTLTEFQASRPSGPILYCIWNWAILVRLTSIFFVSFWHRPVLNVRASCLPILSVALKFSAPFRLCAPANSSKCLKLNCGQKLILGATVLVELQKLLCNLSLVLSEALIRNQLKAFWLMLHKLQHELL